MKINSIGINHETAPVAIREKVAVNADKLGESLGLLSSYTPRGVILSTCNRTEIYTVDAGSGEGEKASLEFLKSRLELPELEEYVYVSQDQDAVKHLFRVASGLESMILGEYEVLGQVRQSLDAAEKAGVVNLPLRHLFEGAIRAGRRVRQETAISKSSLSVSSVAVDLAAEVVLDLSSSTMLILGAGEAGQLVGKVARERGVSKIVVASRTRKRAQVLADNLGGTAISLDELDKQLSKADIVVTCAGAPHRLLQVANVQKVMAKRGGLPLVIIDIALPRNVEPEVGKIGDVFVYNIDDLTEISETNRRTREGEVSHAEQIVTGEIDQFLGWLHDFEVRDVVGALMSKAEEIRAAQLKKTLKKLPPLSDEQQENLEAMTKSIVTRILEDPIKYLKSNGNNKHSEIIKELFLLNTEDPACGQS